MLGDRTDAWLAEETNLPRSTIGDYIRVGIAKADSAVVIADALGCTVDWLLTGRGSSTPAVNRGAVAPIDRADVVDVPVLTAAASAGPGSFLGEAVEERGSVPLPAQWLRRYGTPSKLRLVEVVGGSMTPPLEDGDWILVNLDRTELREGIAVVRYNDTMLIKRLQPQGRSRLVLTSSAEGYEPIPVDLATEGDNFGIIGYAEGRWRARGLA
jgi:phage repressor protein C with HTH and peptisase S24 domain